MKYFLYPILSFLSLYATAQDKKSIIDQNTFSKGLSIDSPKVFFEWGTTMDRLPFAKRPDTIRHRRTFTAMAWDSAVFFDIPVSRFIALYIKRGGFLSGDTTKVLKLFRILFEDRYKERFKSILEQQLGTPDYTNHKKKRYFYHWKINEEEIFLSNPLYKKTFVGVLEFRKMIRRNSTGF